MLKRNCSYVYRCIGLLGLVALFAHCEGGDGDQSAAYSEIENVLTSSLSALPQLQDAIELENGLTIDVPSIDNDGDEALVQQLNQWLEFQCHLPNTIFTINYCPESVNLLTSNTYTPQTLHGQVATAFERVFEIYPNDASYQDCNQSIFSSPLEGEASFSPEDTRNFSLLPDDLWTCLEDRQSNNNSQTYTLYSQATNQTTYALTHVSLDAETSAYLTNAWVDMYARKAQASDDEPEIIAWNIMLAQEALSSDNRDQSSRLILIINTQTGNYIGKYGEKQREALTNELYTPSQDWVMLGRGGFDVIAQLFTQGQYSFRGRLINAEEETFFERQFCINNDATPSFSTTENCVTFEQELTEFFDQNDGFWDSQTLLEFLDLTSEDQSQLSRWEAFLDGPNYLELSDIPIRSDFPTIITDDASTADNDQQDNTP
jgi:hypothetical protein